MYQRRGCFSGQPANPQNSLVASSAGLRSAATRPDCNVRWSGVGEGRGDEAGGAGRFVSKK